MRINSVIAVGKEKPSRLFDTKLVSLHVFLSPRTKLAHNHISSVEPLQWYADSQRNGRLSSLLFFIVADSRPVLPYNSTLTSGTKQPLYNRIPNKSASDCISSMDASYFINDAAVAPPMQPCSEFPPQEEQEEDSYDHSDEDAVCCSRHFFPVEIRPRHQHPAAAQARAQRLQLLFPRLFFPPLHKCLQPGHSPEFGRTVENAVGGGEAEVRAVGGEGQGTVQGGFGAVFCQVQEVRHRADAVETGLALALFLTSRKTGVFVQLRESRESPRIGLLSSPVECNALKPFSRPRTKTSTSRWPSSKLSFNRFGNPAWGPP